VARAWLGYAAVGALLLAVYPFLSDLGATVAFTLASVSSVAAVLIGVRVFRPAHPLPWYLLAAANASFCAGDLVYEYYAQRDVHAPFPGVADVFYLGAYPLLFVAIGLVIRRSEAGDSAAWLDAGIWTGGAVVVGWLPLFSPFVHDDSTGVWSRVIALGYPLMDVVLLLLLVHQLTRRGPRLQPHRLMAIGLAGLFVSDVVYAVRSLNGTYVTGELTDLGWIVSYVALGAAALHPGMPHLTRPGVRVASSTHQRMVFLLAPALAGPALLTVMVLNGDVSGDRAGALVVAGAIAVIFVLSVLRGRGLISELHLREEVLRSALDDRGRMAEELRTRATRCPLTELVNRTGFLEIVTDALDENAPLAIGLLDLDDFKGVNDTLGHDAGDTLLVEVAARLREALGEGDVVGRLGGDEFAVLLRGDVTRTATRLVRVLAAPMVLDGHELRVEASLGLVERSDRSSLGDLLRRADVAMYAAKAAGGNRWVSYRPEMSASLLRRLDLRTQLVIALERKEMGPWFQPIVDLQSGRLVGFEALARWERPGREVQAPSHWIGLAEQTGLVVPIDFTVLEASLTTLAEWRDAQPAQTLDLHLAVNASGRTLQEPGTAARILSLLAQTGIPPECLLLEVTEGVLLEDEAVGRRLQHLRAEGVRIALDDFGTGWSSLSYLSRFPVDVLKLDRSFTATLHRGPGGEAVPAAVVQLAAALELQVVAEGIETPEQASHLRRLGAQCGQGYLYGRPAPAHVTERLFLQPLTVG